VKGRGSGKDIAQRYAHLQELCVILFELFRKHNSVESVGLFRKLYALLVLSGLFFSCCVGVA